VGIDPFGFNIENGLFVKRKDLLDEGKSCGFPVKVHPGMLQLWNVGTMGLKP
jgi:hypothetical protein